MTRRSRSMKKKHSSRQRRSISHRAKNTTYRSVQGNENVYGLDDQTFSETLETYPDEKVIRRLVLVKEELERRNMFPVDRQSEVKVEQERRIFENEQWTRRAHLSRRLVEHEKDEKDDEPLDRHRRALIGL